MCHPTVQEYADMIQTSLWSIIISGTWMSMMTPTYSSKIIGRLNLDIRYPIPFVSRYITCPRSGRRYHIPSSISFPTNTLYSYRNTISLWSNSSITCLQASRTLCYRVGPENIFPSRGWTNPTLDTCNSTSTFGSTWKAPLWSPCYGVTVDTPKVLLWY